MQETRNDEQKSRSGFFFTPSVQLCDLHAFQMQKLLHLR